MRASRVLHYAIPPPCGSRKFTSSSHHGGEDMTTTEKAPYGDTNTSESRPSGLWSVADEGSDESIRDGSESKNSGGGAAAPSASARSNGRVNGDGSYRKRRSDRGVEVRVHGIGDHSTYSALGRPNYKELVDSRVWIGQVPHLPDHPLRLVNWSRANRKITRHLSWYLAFPFTLINLAGYMEPNDKSRHLMRAGISIASLCLTVSMAAWLSVMIETAWQALGHGDDRLTAVLLQAAGPGLLIAFIVYRMLAGRALVDRAGNLISLASIGVLAAMIVFLHSRPAMRAGGWLHDLVTPLGDPGSPVATMSSIVVATTAVGLIVALCLCVCGLSKKNNGAAFAGAAVLVLIAITLLHSAGSMLRMFTSSVVRYVPNASHQQPDAHVPKDSSIKSVLLPGPDDFGNELVSRVENALQIDLIPLFFFAMLALFAAAFWLELSKGRKRGRMIKNHPSADRRIKAASGTHELVVSLPERLPIPATLAIVATPVVWTLLYDGFGHASAWLLADLLVVLQVAGAVAIVLIIIRRPERLSDQFRSVFGSVADIAGFWAPDLHPLAGASYRRALLAGIRQAINDLVLEFPNDPIALVGHSQGSVVCAWFVRGGHWTEQPTEGMTDREALKAGVHRLAYTPRSDRIALFTCGSPLSTLYRTFFPRYFDDAFFGKTWSMTYKSSWWRNYWRKTDPIGSRVPTKRAVDNIDVTERVDEETLGHGEYWRNQRLRNAIDRFFDIAEVSQPVNTFDQEHVSRANGFASSATRPASA